VTQLLRLHRRGQEYQRLYDHASQDAKEVFDYYTLYCIETPFLYNETILVYPSGFNGQVADYETGVLLNELLKEDRRLFRKRQAEVNPS